MKIQLKITWYKLFTVVAFLCVGLTVSCKKNRANNFGSKNTSNHKITANQKRVTQTFTAKLSGDNEVPPVNSDASGSVTLRQVGDSVHVKGQFSGLSSPYTGSHIHQGAKGKNGNVIQPLKPTNNSNGKAGSWGGSYHWDKAKIEALRAGRLYINVHSQNHKKGEIRGQLKPSEKGKHDYQ